MDTSSETKIIVGGILARYQYDLRSKTDPHFLNTSGLNLIASEAKTHRTFGLGEMWYHDLGSSATDLYQDGSMSTTRQAKRKSLEGNNGRTKKPKSSNFIPFQNSSYDFNDFAEMDFDDDFSIPFDNQSPTSGQSNFQQETHSQQRSLLYHSRNSSLLDEFDASRSAGV